MLGETLSPAYCASLHSKEWLCADQVGSFAPLCLTLPMSVSGYLFKVIGVWWKGGNKPVEYWSEIQTFGITLVLCRAFKALKTRFLSLNALFHPLIPPQDTYFLFMVFFYRDAFISIVQYHCTQAFTAFFYCPLPIFTHWGVIAILWGLLPLCLNDLLHEQQS